MNSIIDHQNDWEFYVDIEYQRCKEDKVYYFENYWLINGRKPTKEEIDNFKIFLDYDPYSPLTPIIKPRSMYSFDAVKKILKNDKTANNRAEQ